MNSESSQLPEILYKYTTYDTFLENSELRISPINELNDPFEGMPVIEHFWKKEDFISNYENNLKKIKKSSIIKDPVINEVINKYIRYPNKIYDILKLVIENNNLSLLMKEYFSNDNISVLSLSSCNDSELMWAIYAGSHTGYAIGLRVNNNIFSSDFWEDEKINVGLRKVVYKNEREKFYLEDRDNFCLNTLLFKSKSWEYENEWRLIISNIEKLHSIDIKKGEDNITVNGFLRFPDEAISEIILGYRAEKKIEEQAKEFCKKHNVVLKKAVVDEKKYKINIIKYK